MQVDAFGRTSIASLYYDTPDFRLIRDSLEKDGYKEKITNWTAADINKDGSVDGADSAILRRYVSGWEGYDSYFN